MLDETNREFHGIGVASIANVVLYFCFAGGLLQAQQKSDLQQGPQFQLALKNPGGVSWEGEAPLRMVIDRYSKLHHVAIMIDRRVDPATKVLAAKDVRLETALRALAEQLDLGVCFLESVIYIGPKDTTAHLTTVSALRKEEMRELPDAAKRRLIRASKSEWEELAVPRELIKELAIASGVKIKGIEHVPHDLWPAVHLPSLAFVDRMTLLLAGFGYSFKFAPDGSAIQIIPMPTDVSLTRRYTVAADQTRIIRLLKGRFPKATIEPEGGKIVVVASLDDHDAIRDQLAGKAPRPPKPTIDTQKVYTLNVENKEVGAVAKYLAKEFGMEIKFDATANDTLQELTTFNVKDATVEELFKAVVAPVGLSCRVDGKSVLIFKPD